MSDISSTRSIELPEPVLKRVESRIAYTEFDSVEEYINYVLEEVLHNVEENSEDRVAINESEVKSRLESLGYLNE